VSSSIPANFLGARREEPGSKPLLLEIALPHSDEDVEVMRITRAFFLCLLVIPTTCVSAQSRSKQDRNLEMGINRYSAQVIGKLSKETAESYKVFEKKIFYSDLDNDGDLDAIVELYFCESQRCEPATQSSNVAVFRKDQGGYRFAAGKTFVKFRDDNSIELMGKIKSVKNRKIYFAVYGCEVDDPVCLPRFLYRAIYSFERNKLVHVRSYGRVK
jgi:hypothetical protein